MLKLLKKINWQEKQQEYSKVYERYEQLRKVKSPKISIIVISWRLHYDTLKNFQLLEKQREQNFELIFVNNGAPESEFEILKPYINKYIKLNKNTGAYLARNIGSLFAESGILFFLEDDGIPFENLIENHKKIHSQYKNVKAVRGKYIPKDNLEVNKKQWHYDLGKFPIPYYVNLEGNCSFKAESFYKVKGWNDNIKYGYGGADISYRLRKEYTVTEPSWYFPNVCIFHNYTDSFQNLEKKINKQEDSRKNLLKQYPDFDEFLDHYRALYLGIKDKPKIEDNVHLQTRMHQIHQFYKSLISKSLKRIGWENKEEKYLEVIKRIGILNNVKNPKISIVVISWRLHPDTLKNLKILEKQRNQKFELIFVNNGAAEDEFAELMPFIDKYIRLNNNTGAYLARNIGAVFAESPIIFFLEDDGIPEKDIVEKHLEVHNKYDIIVARGVYKPKTNSPLNKIATHYHLGNKPFPIYADLEGNTTYKTELFYKVGGWDDEIRFGGGGVDLSIRLLAIDPDKRKQIYTPGPIIYHDYAKDEQHFNNKREKQKKSRERLLKIHPNWNEFLSSWEIFWGDSTALITREEKYELRNKITPFITICIPTYNRANYLKEAITSALSQNYENYEILIVDDGSTDNTYNVVKSINSNKIRYMKSDENLGRPKIRNKLVELAKGEFLLWLDDDDILREDILSKYVQILLSNPEVNIIYGNLLQFNDETGKEIQKFIPNDYTNCKTNMLRNLILGNGITFPASLIKKELIKQCGKFDEEYLRAQDYELWTRLYPEAKFHKINDIVCYYRKHNNNVSYNTIIDLSYEAKTVKKVLSEYSLSELFTDFDLYNPEILDHIYYHLAHSLYNYQDYTNSLFYLKKIKNKNNLDFIKLTFASYLSQCEQTQIEEFIENIKTVGELKNLYQEFRSIIKKYNELRLSIEKSIEHKKWNKLEPLIFTMNEELGYIADVPYYLGVLNEQKKNYKEALEFYKQAIRFNPNNDKYYEKAIKLIDENNYLELDKMRDRILYSLKENTQKIIKKDKTLVSVIIPTFNRLQFLKQSLRSVLNQTYKNFEIIVINDAGKDAAKVVESLNDSRIKYIKHEKNLGVSAARNSGLRVAKGKYIAYLDDDDEYYPDHLQLLLEKLEKTDYKVAYSDAYFVHSEYKNGSKVIKSKTVPYSYDFSKELLLIMNIAPTQCFMHAKECVENVGFFNEHLSTHEDWEFWIRLSLKYNFGHIKKVTSQVNRREIAKSVTNTNLEDFLRTMRIIYNKYKYLTKGNKKIIEAQQKRAKDLLIAIKQEQGASIIIVTYNSEKTIASCIKSTKKTLREYDEVVIVDNASRDKTIKIIEKHTKKSKQFKVIKSKENLGFSEGCNVGIKNSNNPFVVLLNPDTNVTDQWLDKMISVCKKENVAAVGPISNYAAGYQNILAYLDKKELSSIKPEQLPKEVSKRFNRKVIETKLLIGFCMVIKRSLLNELGGLDEELFLGNDDLDLSWRFRLKGYKLLVAVDTFVYHEGQVSFKTEKKLTTNVLVQESTDKLYKKLVSHYGKGNVPTPMELWGMNWFTPSDAKFNNSSKLLDSKTRGVSIVIPTFNQWEYTKQTIESIKEFTDLEYEIIIVDNASSDETIEELKKYESIKVITNQENLGFPKAINQGILAAKGDFVLLLNNDVVVTKNWLSKMVAVAKMKKDIGIVGPVSNSVSGVQLDKDAKYKSIDAMHEYAETVSEKNKGKTLQFPRVAFLCTLIKKEVIDKIGGLDERFTPGNFEDDDFCLRSQIAGFKTVIASDIFIHHYGSVSFKKNGENKYAKRLEINKQKFVDKWGGTPEEIWLQGKQYLKKEVRYPIDNDLFNQSIARAFINIDDEEYDFALENLNLALDSFDNSKRVGYENITKEEILNLIGTLLLSKNDLEEAKKYFEQELNENPNSSPACFGLGEVFYKAEMYEESKTMYEWAVVNNENNKNAQIRLQHVNTKLNLPPEHNTILVEANQGVE